MATAVVRLALAALLLGAGAPTQQAADPHRPVPVYDRVPPALPAGLHDAVLILSKTNGWRHLEHIPHSNAVLADIARAQGRGVFQTENAAVFTPALLRRFRVVVLNSASGDLFTPAQRQAFTDYLKRGGGLVALHGAGGDTDQPWAYYIDQIIGARFIGHPDGTDQFQSAPVRLVRPDHPVLAGVSRDWAATDEWYSFDRVPGGSTTVLATIDEAAYRRPPKLDMGAVHPVIWARQLGRGRIVFSALGHRPEAYDDPDYRRLIANAIAWTAARR